MASEIDTYGKTEDGVPVEVVTLRNRSGAFARIITYGATITELHIPDRNGSLGDVVLGHDSLSEYEKGKGYLGATVGRVANRIAGGKFLLDGVKYKVPANDEENVLHGGPLGYSKRVWDLSDAPDQNTARFRLTDPDGCMGFPGTVSVRLTYELTDTNTLKISYHAKADRSTPINLTNHAYFNLTDAGKTPISDHVIQINAFRYTPVDESLIPTGKIESVEGSRLDLRMPTRIGENLEHIEGNPPGYDHNYVLSNRRAAEVFDPVSGRRMVVMTGQPGVQFYTGNQLDGSQGGKGAIFGRYHGFCLESQHFPDSVNHPNFPSTIVKPGSVYEYTTEYRFSTE
jgi:aldose 1-epimerase